jgi:hypothetical protein
LDFGVLLEDDDASLSLPKKELIVICPDRDLLLLDGIRWEVALLNRLSLLRFLLDPVFVS